MIYGCTLDLFKRTDNRLTITIQSEFNQICVKDTLIERDAKNLRDALIAYYPINGD